MFATSRYNYVRGTGQGDAEEWDCFALFLQASRTWFGRVATSDLSKVRKLIYIVTLKRDLTFEWHNKIQFQNRKKNQ